MVYLFNDSSAHVLYSWWNFTGELRLALRYQPVSAWLFGPVAACGADLLYVPIAAHALLGAASLFFLFDATRRIEPRAAWVAPLLGLTLPPFGMLIFSGMKEMLSLALVSFAFWTACINLDDIRKPRLLPDLVALGALGLAACVRIEALVYWAVYGACVMIRWRQKRGAAAVLAAWGLGLLLLRAPVLLGYGREYLVPDVGQGH